MFIVYPVDTEISITERIDMKLATNTKWFGKRYPAETAREIALTIIHRMNHGETKFKIEGDGYDFHVRILKNI